MSEILNDIGLDKMKKILHVFHRIINGNLRPHLFEDNLDFFDIEAFTIVPSITNELDIQFDGISIFSYFKDGDEVILDVDEVQNKITLSVPAPLESLIDIDIPPPPTQKSESYHKTLEIIYNIAHNQITSKILEINSKDELKSYSYTNSRIIERLLIELQNYKNELVIINKDKLSDSNYYIVYITKVYLNRLKYEFKLIQQTDKEKIKELKLIFKNLIKNEIKVKNPRITQRDFNEEKKSIINIFVFMSGLNSSKIKIMSDESYSQLIEDIFYMVKNDELPEIKKPLNEINISTEAIRYSFYLLHKEIYGTQRINDIFINFIHAYFKQFNNTEKRTTKTKFSQPPKLYPC